MAVWSDESGVNRSGDSKRQAPRISTIVHGHHPNKGTEMTHFNKRGQIF